MSGTTIAAALTITNIAALRAYSGIIPPVCQVEGYYSGADGGEGSFWYNASDTTSSDDGGTIIVDAASRRWYRLTGGLPYSVKWFGAKGDGVTNDAPSVQNAVTAAIRDNASVYVPRVALGFMLGATIEVPSSISILGGGWSADEGGHANFLQNALGLSSFHVTAFGSVRFQDISIGRGALVAQTSGTAITFDCGVSRINFFSRILNCYFYAQNLAIDFERTAGFLVEWCDFLSNHDDIVIRHLTNEDAGDSTVSQCLFEQDASSPLWGGVNVGIGINQFSSGGLKILGCKFNGHSDGYVLNLNTPITQTSDLIIQGCSFENMPSTAITLQQNGLSTEAFQNVQVIGNQIAAVNFGFFILDSVAIWIHRIVVTGNIIDIMPGTGAGIVIENGTDGVVDHNVISSEDGNGTGITISNRAAGIIVGAANAFINCLVNLAVATTNIVEPVVKSGALSGVTNAAYGPLFVSAAIVVTFDVPYKTAPFISGSPTSSGCVSMLVSSVSASGFQANVIGVLNATSYSCNWMAAGN